MKQVKILIGALVLIMVTSCGKGDQSKQEVEGKKYPVMEIVAQDARIESVYPGTIKGQEDIEIKPRVDGFIDDIYVDEGSIVKAGQALFKISSPSSEQSLISAEASVSSAKAQVSTAELNVQRYTPLAEKGIVSKVQLKTHENALESSKAALAQAEAMLKNAQVIMGWTTVTSPIKGIVGSIPYRKGSLVNSGHTLTAVSNIDNVYAYFSLNEKRLMELLGSAEGVTQAEKIKNLPPVSLILADGSEYEEKGKIETITGIIDVTTGSANFRAEFPNQTGRLRSGTSAKVVMPKTLMNVFVIPQKATFRQQDKVLVYKLMEGNVIEQQIISVVIMPNGQDYAVTEGLSAGDKVVSDGIATLHNGMTINIK